MGRLPAWTPAAAARAAAAAPEALAKPAPPRAPATHGLPVSGSTLLLARMARDLSGARSLDQVADVAMRRYVASLSRRRRKLIAAGVNPDAPPEERPPW